MSKIIHITRSPASHWFLGGHLLLGAPTHCDAAKYIWHEASAVRVVGMLHGVLWLPYVGLACYGALKKSWSWRIAIYLFIASLLPLDPSLQKKLFKKDPNRVHPQ